MSKKNSKFHNFFETTYYNISTKDMPAVRGCGMNIAAFDWVKR